jgi:hypothetical protein
MNMAARTFQSLISTLQSRPESYRAELLCRELHAWLMDAPNYRALVAFIYRGNLDRYRWNGGTLAFLQQSGITLTQRPHLSEQGWFIFAEVGDPQTMQPRTCDMPILESAA